MKLPASRKYQRSNFLICNPQKDDSELTIGGQLHAQAKATLNLVGPYFPLCVDQPQNAYGGKPVTEKICRKHAR
jgi:hypothetical protein